MAEREGGAPGAPPTPTTQSVPEPTPTPATPSDPESSPVPATRRPRNPHRAETWQPTILRRVHIRAVEDLSLALLRVTFEGEELGEIAAPTARHAAGPDAGVHSATTSATAGPVSSPSFDDVVVLCLPDPDTGQLTLPIPGQGGGLAHPPGRTALVREYTVRSLRDRLLTVDLLRHAAGAGGRWAENVQPGDPLTIIGPRVSRALPPVDRMIAVGDATALPALARLIEDRPTGLALDVVAAVPDLTALPRTLLPAVSPTDAGHVRVRMVADAAGSATALLAALADSDVPSGFAWVAGESGMVAAVRRHLLDRGQAPDRLQFTGYWRLGGPL